ncbi:hypothetical protein [Cohnella hongkongensis]|uniref:Uncharacterized protein n=1 Tax=Cohnella hongkongensis TaxID=178337 RepID=A0ABV9FGX8_9BACL
MSVSVKKLILFTVSACPIGRTMHTVINELLDRQKDLAYERVYLDINHEETNRYRVKVNPTTIFLDGNDVEVYRMEGFKETDEIRLLIRQVEEGLLRTEAPHEENREITETYTIYLFKNGNPVPVETTVINKTSVKAPRITAIQQLLLSRSEGFDNPFPIDTSLDQVSFHHDTCVITFRSTTEVRKHDVDRMKRLLVCTMRAYGISEIKVEWTSMEKRNSGV